ncbi:MAG: dihydroorotate dehydrogenase [Sporolactobacillus sp.]
MLEPDLSVDIAGMRLKNPIMPASGTFGLETARLMNADALGAIVAKSITPGKRSGNVGTRICEVNGGMMNAVGIPSGGIDDYIERIVPLWSVYSAPLIASLSGETVDEFCNLAERLDEVNTVSALELNISCPNLRDNGAAFGMSAAVTCELVAEVRRVTRKPIIAKLSPNVTRIQDIAVAAEAGGADALTVANTFLAMAIDIETRRPKLGHVMGGLSGPLIKPLIVRLIYQVHQVSTLPVIGSGGAVCGKDVVEMMLAGASAVQIGTANFTSPHAMTDIIQELRDYLISRNIKEAAQLIGKIDVTEETGV